MFSVLDKFFTAEAIKNSAIMQLIPAVSFHDAGGVHMVNALKKLRSCEYFHPLTDAEYMAFKAWLHQMWNYQTAWLKIMEAQNLGLKEMLAKCKLSNGIPYGDWNAMRRILHLLFQGVCFFLLLPSLVCLLSFCN